MHMQEIQCECSLLVAITEGQDMLTDNSEVLENDNDTVMVKMHYKYLIFYFKCVVL